MIFKQVDPSKSICFLFGMWIIYLRKTLRFRIFVCTAPLDLLVSWRAGTLTRLARMKIQRLEIFTFWNLQMANFKGLEPQNGAFYGNLWNSINSKFRWSISLVQTVKKNLRKSVSWCTRIKCHESGMTPSNSEKSHLDVQSLIPTVSANKKLTSQNQDNFCPTCPLLLCFGYVRRMDCPMLWRVFWVERTSRGGKSDFRVSGGCFGISEIAAC